jgi:hypothetical protein
MMNTPREDFEKWTTKVDRRLENNCKYLKFLPRKSRCSEVFWNILCSVAEESTETPDWSDDTYYIMVSCEDMARALKILGMCIDEGEE